MVKKTQNTQETPVSAKVEENQPSEKLRANLTEIAKQPGVIGYILRNTTSAIIDLKESAKIVEYAMLSAQALDSSKELSELFNIGATENILIQGKDTKTLCIVMGENKAAVFMEKDVDDAEILKQATA
jgi:predicted regulator of Ras-like GTPase activity (Roadblock/LC7/MglB family)